jgi:hypothetical protein
MKKEELFYKQGFRITENGNILNKKGQSISGYKNQDGYIRISSRYEGAIVNCFVHRLQAFQKYGELLFYKGVEVRHKNNDKSDNSYNNILIGTHKKNILDTPESIRIERALHASSFIRKYNKKEVREFHKNNGNSYKKTMAEFGMSSKGTLHYILKEKENEL